MKDNTQDAHTPANESHANILYSDYNIFNAQCIYLNGLLLKIVRYLFSREGYVFLARVVATLFILGSSISSCVLPRGLGFEPRP